MGNPVMFGARPLGVPQDVQGPHGLQQADPQQLGQGPGRVPLPGHMQGVAPPDVARQEGQRHVPQPQARELAGHVRPGGFFANIRNWFAEVRLSRTATAGLPEQVDVPMPGGGHVSWPGSSLAQMIRALPKAQRAEARETLAARLGERLEHGQQLLRAVLAGNAPERTEVQDVADLMLLLDAKARVSGDAFSEGAFSLEDPQGRLAAFLNRCPEKYQRSSSHMRALQRAEVDDHANTHRGIDVPQGPSGLPHGRATTLFGVIPGGEGGVPARRLFLKMESHGCRLSTLGRAEHAAGQDDVPDRPVRLLSDIGSFFGHALSFLATRGQGSAEGSRKERIPDVINNGYKAILQASEGKLSEAQMAILRRNDPTGTSGGVRVMLANMRDAIAAMPHGAERNSFIRQCAGLVRTMEQRLDQPDHPDSRIGNEVMFDTADLAGDLPPALPRPGALDRMLFPVPLNPAQQEALERMPPAQRMHVLSVLPQATDALTGMLGLGIGAGPAARRGVDSSVRIMEQYDALARCIEGTSDSIDSAAENMGRVLSFALLGMPDHQVQDIHAQIASPEGERMRALVSANTMAFTQGARETPASAMIGYLSKFVFLSSTLVGELENRLQVPQAMRRPAMLDTAQYMAVALEDVANNVGDDSKLRVDGQGLAESFRLDVLERADTLTVGGVAVKTAEDMVQAVPDPALRAVVTRLACQAPLGAVLEMSASHMGSASSFLLAGQGAGEPGAGSTFTFDPATGRLTGRRVETPAMMVAGGENRALSPDSRQVISFACTVRMVDGRPQISDVQGNVDYDWDLAEPL